MTYRSHRSTQGVWGSSRVRPGIALCQQLLPGAWQSRSPWGWVDWSSSWHQAGPSSAQGSQETFKVPWALPPPTMHIGGSGPDRGTPALLHHSGGRSARTAGAKTHGGCPSLSLPASLTLEAHPTLSPGPGPTQSLNSSWG